MEDHVIVGAACNYSKVHNNVLVDIVENLVLPYQEALIVQQLLRRFKELLSEKEDIKNNNPMSSILESIDSKLVNEQESLDPFKIGSIVKSTVKVRCRHTSESESFFIIPKGDSFVVLEEINSYGNLLLCKHLSSGKSLKLPERFLTANISLPSLSNPAKPSFIKPKKNFKHGKRKNS